MTTIDRTAIFDALRRAVCTFAFAATATISLGAQDPPKDAVCRMCHPVATAAIAAADPAKHVAAHGKVACIDCHTALRSFDPTDGDHAIPVAAVDCASCHAKEARKLAESVHAAAATCTDCHARHAIGLEKLTDKHVEATACSICHALPNADWETSVHGLDPGNGQDAARCNDCHGAHDILASKDVRSRTHPLQLPDTCESCHKPNPSAAHPAPAGAKVEQYETSAHGLALREKGLIVTATCVSCHRSHDVVPPTRPDAPTSRLQIPNTCGACHAGVLRSYLEGVHGKNFLAGSADVPVCTDCHREHGVQSTYSATSSVSAALVAETCARCHNDDELAKRYGFKEGARSSWGSSYHGIASSFGDTKAANCASCHGFHDIFPSKDPRSRVNVANLDATCGGCHSNASAAFARVPVHSVISEASNPIAWWVKRIYAVLVGGMIGAFLFFIAADLFGRLRIRLRVGPGETEHVERSRWSDEDRLIAPHETFRRMGLHARLQHGVLITSFSLLVLTGLPVFLHDSSWMRSIIDLEGGFVLRSRLHRIAAFGLIGLSLWHAASIAIAPGARRWFASMIIKPRDVFDFLQDALFNLGFVPWLARRRPLRGFFERRPKWICERRPCMARYGLVEKLEYGAVLWGNVVMIATGAILWRPDWFLDWTPSWTFDVCRVVHGFEATLAFLAIIVWHMYHVHLRPGAFPMSHVWLSGRISRDELREHHPAEYLRILERRRAKSRELAPVE